jgi:hypothetical protein
MTAGPRSQQKALLPDGIFSNQKLQWKVLQWKMLLFLSVFCQSFAK